MFDKNRVQNPSRREAFSRPQRHAVWAGLSALLALLLLVAPTLARAAPNIEKAAMFAPTDRRAVVGGGDAVLGVVVDYHLRLFHADLPHVLIIGGESSQWWGPMGVAVIWGLAVATFLTLVVVPVMYSSLDPLKRGLRRVLLDWWWRGAPDA